MRSALRYPTVARSHSKLVLLSTSLSAAAFDPNDRCDHRCQRQQCRTQTDSVTTWPRVLTIHLKKWLPTRFHAVFNKEPRYVKFPTVLTDEHLPSYGGAGYSLRRVIVHHGDAYGGHYTTFALSDDGGVYDYNDARSPREVSFQEVTQSQASLLFYEHR